MVTASVFSSALIKPFDRGLSELVEQGSRHAAAAYTSPYAMAFDGLDTIELPPGAETRVDQAQMRALAALYLSADLEPAGVFSAVEDLAALAASGALRVDLGPATQLIHSFWRNRNQRSSQTERLAFYGRLFGATYGAYQTQGANDNFETLMLELCESLYQLGESISSSPHGGITHQTRIRAGARNLLSNLVSAGGGATPFMAREVMDGLKAALQILKHPHLQSIFGARDIWGVVSAIGRLSQRTPVADPQLFVRRGRAGMILISWLAEAAQALRVYGAPLVANDHSVITAAVDWLQASLTISELQSNYSPASAPDTSGGVSDWASLGI
ncbi:MAG: hypothetical protein WCY88_03650 [Spongiibacteraceae bacterium]